MKQLHWPLSSYDADNDRFVDISGKTEGIAIGLSDATATATTTNERYFGDVFAMVDRPNDGNDNYELLHRARHDDCPDSIAEANGFKTVSDDIFVRPENGNFFHALTAMRMMFCLIMAIALAMGRRHLTMIQAQRSWH